MKCNHCGASLRPTAKLCIQCGNAVGTAPEPVAAPAPAVADVPAAPAAPEQSQTAAPAQEASPLVPDTTPAPVLDEPAPPAPVQEPVQVPAQAAVQMPEELPVQAPAAAPEIATAPAAQATAKYEVAPEFATPPAAPSPAPAPASANSAKQAQATSKSGVKMAVGGLGLLTAGAVAYFALAGGSKAPAPQEAPAPAQVAAPAAPAAPAPAAVAARTVDKAFINDMLQLVGQDQWSALADMVSNAQAQANPNAQALREQAQTALSSRNHAQAQKLTLELLLTDPQSGSAWLLASQVFAAQDITQPAQSALKLAYYFAKDRAQALSSLAEFARAAEPKFKAVANQTSPQLPEIPARKP
ncbi:MAG: zinc-ribbon domain-containing protein [Limnohabitans sp.]|nr:zinc-ribbon domain-containing protein [Limnohabitans sp.]